MGTVSQKREFADVYMHGRKVEERGVENGHTRLAYTLGKGTLHVCAPAYLCGLQATDHSNDRH